MRFEHARKRFDADRGPQRVSSGFRAYTRHVLETIPWDDNSDDFVFDSQMLVQCVAFRFRIGEIPVPVRYHDTASSINLKRSIIYGLRTLQTVGRYLLFRLRLSDPPMFKRRRTGGLE